MPVDSIENKSKGSLLIGLFSMFCSIPVVMMGYLWVFLLTVSFDPPGSRNTSTLFLKIADGVVGIIVTGVYYCDYAVALLLIAGGFMIAKDRSRQTVSMTGIYISMACAAGAVISSFLCIPIWIPRASAAGAFLLAVQMLLPVAGYAVCPLVLFALLRKFSRS